MNEKKEVIKHSAAIQIQNNITLLQRRAWNVLLANAYEELPDEAIKEHRMPIRDLMRMLEFDSNNIDYLKDALRALRSCNVEWNILGKDKDEWKNTGLLAEVGVEKDHTSNTYTCTYAYGPSLRERLHNPRMYARLSLSMQNKFVSKHAQVLWELCVDYLNESRNYGETRFISLADYRKLMGITEDMYPLFKRLNDKVIKDSIKEINAVTDFHVEPEYQRQGRKVVAVKFKVRRILQIPGQHPKQGALFPEYEDAPLVWELKHAGLSAEEAWKIWQQGFEGVNPDKRPQGAEWDTYLQEKLDLLRRRNTMGKVTSSTGFLLEAIKKNYSNAEFTEAARKKTTEQQTYKKTVSQRHLTQAKEQLEDSHAKEFHAHAVQLTQETPSLLAEAVDYLLKNDAGFQRLYAADKTPAENYQAVFLASYLDQHLARQHPEHFAPLREAHAARLAELTTQ